MFGAIHTYSPGNTYTTESDNKAKLRNSALEGLAVPIVRDRETLGRERNLRVGDIVMRGPDWEEGDSEDGGLDSTGEVVSSKHERYCSSIEVQWDTDIKCEYRYGGVLGSYALQRILT